MQECCPVCKKLVRGSPTGEPGKNDKKQAHVNKINDVNIVNNDSCEDPSVDIVEFSTYDEFVQKFSNIKIANLEVIKPTEIEIDSNNNNKNNNNKIGNPQNMEQVKEIKRIVLPESLIINQMTRDLTTRDQETPTQLPFKGLPRQDWNENMDIGTKRTTENDIL